MNLAVLRKIIREELGVLPKFQNNSDLDSINLADIDYIKNFTLIDSEKNENGSAWKFKHKAKDYLLNFYIKRDKNDIWSGELKIYWKKKTKNPTSGAGKDFQMSFGPQHGFKKFVDGINLRLRNHPLISTKIYHDDWNDNLDILIKKLLIQLKEKAKHIHKINNPYFDDLKKLYEKAKNIKEEDLKKFSNDQAPDDSMKQSLIMTLQKMEKIPFYIGLEKHF